MPGCFDSDSDERRYKKAKLITARLIAKGLNPRGNGFARAFHKAMRK